MDADVLIVGAGCAGLSLAVHLLDATGSDLEIVLLDRRAEHVRDRTWCYFSGPRHPFESAVRKSWPRWKVLTSAGEVERGSTSVAYCFIPADAFYELALERIRRSPNVRLLRGVSVEGFRDSGGGVAALTADGEITARRAFDSRPPEPGPVPPGEIHWLQHFVGLEVETDRPVFDPSVATLMDFRVMDGPDIRFMYVLPLDERTALVEDTFFGGEPGVETDYVESIRGYLADRLGVHSWREVHREKGAIPMSTVAPPRPATARVTNIGSTRRTGAARHRLRLPRHSEAFATPGRARRAGSASIAPCRVAGPTRGPRRSWTGCSWPTWTANRRRRRTCSSECSRASHPTAWLVSCSTADHIPTGSR